MLEEAIKYIIAFFDEIDRSKFSISRLKLAYTFAKLERRDID